MFISKICNLFKERNIPFAIVGGYAVALHGVMRDSLDIIITEDLRQVETVEVTSDFGKVPVLSINSLIKMKGRANREQDQKDIAALKAMKDKPQ